MQVDLIQFPTAQKAHEAAMSESSAVDRRLVSGRLFKQSGVWMFSTAFHMKDIEDLTYIHCIDPNGDALVGFNRPEVVKHTKEITEYFLTASPYICPALTLNLLQAPRIFTTDFNSNLRDAWIILPAGYIFQIADGQHRTKGIIAAIKLKPELGDDGVPVHIILEDDVARIHQYFADCSKSLAISPSMTQIWDPNYVLNRLSAQVREAVPFFRDNLEVVAKSVNLKSNKAFLVSNVNAAFTECITFRAEEKGPAIRAALERAFKNYGSDRLIDEVELVFRTFYEHNPQWREYSEGTSALPLAQLRKQYLTFNRIGLRLVGRLGYTIMRTVDDRDKQIELLTRLAKLDFHRMSVFWRINNVIGEDGVIKGSNAPIRRATEAVEAHLGLAGLREAYEKEHKAAESKLKARERQTIKLADAIRDAGDDVARRIVDSKLSQSSRPRRPRLRSR